MDKPLIRWTIGPVSRLGFATLSESVRQFRKIYRDEFDMIICHNQLKNEDIEKLKPLNCELYCQQPHEFVVPPVFWNREKLFSETRNCWKLHPPRLRMNSHEIVLDNDVIFMKRIPQIDEFLQKEDETLMSTGMGRNFGIFDKKIAPGLALNSGIYGVPPGFNLERQVTYLARRMPRGWTGYFDDQGIIAAALSSRPMIVIPRTVVEFAQTSLEPNRCGYHFIHINTMEYNEAWNMFKKVKIMI